MKNKLLKIDWEDRVMEVVDKKYMEDWFKEVYEDAEVELESNNIESGNGKVKEWFVLDDESVSFIEFGSWPKLKFSHNRSMTIITNNTDVDKSLYLHYTIENIINGLKYIESEVDVDNTPAWNSIRKQLETIDNNVDRLVNRTKWKWSLVKRG